MKLPVKGFTNRFLDNFLFEIPTLGRAKALWMEVLQLTQVLP
jgi:hypothetical protein